MHDVIEMRSLPVAAPLSMDEALNDRLLIRPERVAVALDLSRSQVAEMIATGELPSIEIGRSRRILVGALRQWIAERAAGQGTA